MIVSNGVIFNNCLSFNVLILKSSQRNCFFALPTSTAFQTGVLTNLAPFKTARTFSI